MTNSDLAAGAVWRLWHGDEQIAQLTVVDTDFPWVHATIEELPGFEPFRALFAEQEQADDTEDYERADAVYYGIREALRMTFPDGSPVAEFWLKVHGGGTCGWRWSDTPFEEDADPDHDLVMITARRIITSDAAIIHRLGTI
jgi:hypothetical protein